MGPFEKPNYKSPAWFKLVQGSGVQAFYWLAASFFPLLFLSTSPLVTLGLAALGGLFLGRETARAFEGGFARERPSETSPTRAAIWHWLIVAAIGLNYAWFVFTDRPFVPGVIFLIVLIVLRWIRTRSLFPLTPLDLPIAVLLLLATLFSAVISAKTSLSYPKLYGVAFSIVLFYEIVYGLQQDNNLIRWLVVLHLLGLAIAGLGLVGTDWFLNKIIDLSEVYALIPQKIVNVPRYVLPSVDTVNDGSYPVSRPLYMYTAGEPSGRVKAYMDWILSAGQSLVLELGFVPLQKSAD